jgi:hypothetical protein
MFKKIILLFIAFAPSLTLADLNDEVANIVVRAIDFHASLVARNPQLDHSSSQRSVGVKILKFDIFMAHNDNWHATDTYLKLSKEVYIDFVKDECQRNSESTYCEALVRDLADYKTRYGSDYTPKPITYPQFSTANHTFTLPSGRTYDLNQKAFVSGN